jgi:hypothetical protein
MHYPDLRTLLEADAVQADECLVLGAWVGPADLDNVDSTALVAASHQGATCEAPQQGVWKVLSSCGVSSVTLGHPFPGSRWLHCPGAWTVF